MSDDCRLVIRGPADVVSFLSTCGVPRGEPAHVVLGLARDESQVHAHVVCGAAVRAVARPQAPVDADELVELAGELVVGALVLVTIEAGGARAPSRHEIRRFVALRADCAREGVALLDWVVLVERHWWSMRERVIHEAA
jgi:hypothetical protein